MEVWQSPAYCTGLENQRGGNTSVSSNLTASARIMESSHSWPSALAWKARGEQSPRGFESHTLRQFEVKDQGKFTGRTSGLLDKTPISSPGEGSVNDA